MLENDYGIEIYSFEFWYISLSMHFTTIHYSVSISSFCLFMWFVHFREGTNNIPRTGKMLSVHVKSLEYLYLRKLFFHTVDEKKRSEYLLIFYCCVSLLPFFFFFLAEKEHNHHCLFQYYLVTELAGWWLLTLRVLEKTLKRVNAERRPSSSKAKQNFADDFTSPEFHTEL